MRLQADWKESACLLPLPAHDMLPSFSNRPLIRHPIAATVLLLSRLNIARLRRLSTYIVAKSCPGLQDQALLGLLLFPGQQGSPGGVLEYFSDALVRLG